MKTVKIVIYFLAIGVTVLLALNIDSMSKGIDEIVGPVVDTVQHYVCMALLWLLVLAVVLLSVVGLIVELFGNWYNNKYGGFNE